MNSINDSLESNPIIGALPHMVLPDPEEQEKIEVFFLLSGNIMEIQNRVALLKDIGKKVFVHADLIDGLAKDATAIDYIQKHIKPDGILSTRSHLVRYGKEIGLLTVQRIFMIDSLSFESGIKMVDNYKPDFVEVMPGIIPRAISELKEKIAPPIIAGGMITQKSDVIQALKAGAIAVSTSKRELWSLD
ncbi:MAG: glycerol-3-phosphate responsive antiterminator [Clostridiales bacterium]|nr:glycerol-3-phosphate responsive antiterminator [Clostridiales bacterium]